MKRATILLLVMVTIPACDQVPMTRFEYGDVAIAVGGRLSDGPGEAVALGPAPTGFARFSPRNRMVTIEAKFVELDLSDRAFLEIQFWPGFGDPISPSSWTDLTPQAPGMSVGFGFGVGGGGDGYNDGYNDRVDSGGRFGTGVGVGFPISVDDGRGVTHVRAEFPLEVTATVSDSYVFILAALEREMDGRIIAQPMLLPMQLTTPADTAGTPAPETREVETQVLVVDGETIVLGGLYETETEAVDEVPILGDLPGLARLFRGDNDQLIKRNLLIVVTPRIIVDPGS